MREAGGTMDREVTLTTSPPVWGWGVQVRSVWSDIRGSGQYSTIQYSTVLKFNCGKLKV